MNQDQFNEIQAMARAAKAITTDQNPDAQFFAWWQRVLGISLLGTTGENFEAFKSAYFANAKPLQPTAINPDDGPDEAFFAWLESSKIPLMDLDGDGFEEAKQSYCMATGQTQADAGYNPGTDTNSAAKASRIAGRRYNDSDLCDLLGVSKERLQILATWVGGKRDDGSGMGVLDQVLMDEDDCVGSEDAQYLGLKKVRLEALEAKGYRIPLGHFDDNAKQDETE